MPSRRTLSNSKLIPVQVAAVNPFASFNSDSVNRLTRIVSGGKDSVIYGLDVVNGDNNSYVADDELVASYADTTSFNQNWTGENYYFIENSGVELYLPSGKTYGFSYIECKLDPEKTDYLYGSHREFQISFDLSIGTPKALVVSVNDSKFTFDHPNGITENTYTVTIDRDLINDKKENGLTFRIGVVLDSADPDAIKSYDNVNYHTSVRIWNMSCKLIQNNKYENRTAPAINYNGIYSINHVHNLHTIEVTPGIAIKDDVMLQIKGNIHSGRNAAIRLDVSDNYSWIKGKAFSSMDFPPETNQQIVYQCNGINKELGRHSASFKTTEETEVKWGKMEIELDTDNKCYLSGDYDLTRNTSGDILDRELAYQYSYDQNTDTHTFKSDIAQSMGTYGGTSVLFTYIDKDNNYVSFAKTIVDPETSAFKIDLKTSELPIGLKEIIDNGEISKIHSFAQIGPFKVSGDPKEYVTSNVRWAYVVLYYSYFKNPKPNIAYIGLAREEDVKDIKYGEDYLILAKVRFIDVETVDIISYEDRQFVKFPTADQIAYGPTCGDPEIWDGTLPGSVSEAISVLRTLLKYSIIAKSLKEPIIANLPEKFQD